jgi:hypothetical protein
MAYPGSTLPSDFVYVKTDVEATPPAGKKFVAFTQLGNYSQVTFKTDQNSAGIFELNEAKTGYESAGSNGVTFNVRQGATIYGSFTSIKFTSSLATNRGIAYIG